ISLDNNISQPDQILANAVIGHQAKRRPGSGEIGLAVTKHDGVQVDPIFIDQAKLGEALRQRRAGNLDLPAALGLQRTNRALEIVADKRGVGPDRLQRARDDPFRLVPPRRREGLFLCIPFRMIVVPVTHDLIHLETVDPARLPLSLLDEVAEERGAWRKRHMVDVAVQGLVHSEHELGHPTSFPHAASPSSATCRGIRLLRLNLLAGRWRRRSLHALMMPGRNLLAATEATASRMASVLSPDGSRESSPL